MSLHNYQIMVYFNSGTKNKFQVLMGGGENIALAREYRKRWNHRAIEDAPTVCRGGRTNSFRRPMAASMRLDPHRRDPA